MLIHANEITIRVGERLLFENTNWKIESQTNWAILGPTGSGKSILARAIGGRLPVIRGSFIYYFDSKELDGRTYVYPDEIVILSAETHRYFINQFAAYHQARWQSTEGDDCPTVQQLLNGTNGVLPSSKLSIDPKQTGLDSKENLDQLVRLFGLENLLNRKIVHLSHGESRKVYLSWLLVGNPRLLILDDPFTGLDPSSRARLKQGIDELIKIGNTQIIVAGSRLEDIPSGIDHFLVVEENRVVDIGLRQEILTKIGKKYFGEPESPEKGVIQISPSFHNMVNDYCRVLEKKPLETPVIIHMANVSVHYNEMQILNDIQWTVKQGERWALMGDNGAGKSTLLSLILADNPQAYANEVTVFGKRRGSGETIWEIKEKIGWVSPELQIFYGQSNTCLNVVCSGFFDSIGLYQHCSNEQREEAEKWMNAFGIISLAEEPFNALSAGRQRLVLLARALVKKPPLLILDEPCQGLDDEHRRTFIAFLNYLCVHSPVSLIYVTHYLDEIPKSVTRRIRLDHGRQLQE